LAQLQQYLNETVPEHILCHTIAVGTHKSVPPPAHAPATVSVPRPLDSLPILVRRFRRFECDALVSTAADLRWCPIQGCGHILQRCTTQGACSSRASHASRARATLAREICEIDASALPRLVMVLLLSYRSLQGMQHLKNACKTKHTPMGS
jgi:hypothetical protein